MMLNVSVERACRGRLRMRTALLAGMADSRRGGEEASFPAGVGHIQSQCSVGLSLVVGFAALPVSLGADARTLDAALGEPVVAQIAHRRRFAGRPDLPDVQRRIAG